MPSQKYLALPWKIDLSLPKNNRKQAKGRFDMSKKMIGGIILLAGVVVAVVIILL